MLNLMALLACNPDASTEPTTAEVTLVLDDDSTLSQIVHVDFVPIEVESAIDVCLPGTMMNVDFYSFDIGNPTFPNLEPGAAIRSRPGHIDASYGDDGGFTQLEIRGEPYEWHGTLTIASVEPDLLEIVLADGMLCPAGATDCVEMGGTLTIAGARDLAEPAYESAGGEWEDVDSEVPYCMVTEYRGPTSSD
jgi:hypothetical protein